MRARIAAPGEEDGAEAARSVKAIKASFIFVIWPGSLPRSGARSLASASFYRRAGRFLPGDPGRRPQALEGRNRPFSILLGPGTACMIPEIRCITDSRVDCKVRFGRSALDQPPRRPWRPVSPRRLARRGDSRGSESDRNRPELLSKATGKSSHERNRFVQLGCTQHRSQPCYCSKDAPDPDAVIAPLIANHAMKRLAQPEEIAAAAFFLASDRPARSNRLVSHQSDRH